jgi:hypothetical protein
MMLDSQLIDAVYEAAIVPEKWDALLHSLCASGDFQGGAMLAIAPMTSVAPMALRRKSALKYNEVYADLDLMAQVPNVRFQRAIGHRQWYFQSDLELCTQDELDHDEAYRAYLYPNGLNWTIGCPIPVPGADMVVFDFGRSRDAGPFSDATTAWLNALRPELARAAFVAAQPGLERARNAVETLSALGLPGAALTRTGKVVAANDLLRRVSPPVRIGAFDQVSSVDANVSRQLQLFFAGAAAGTTRGVSIPVSGTETNDPAPLATEGGGRGHLQPGAVSAGRAAPRAILGHPAAGCGRIVRPDAGGNEPCQRVGVRALDREPCIGTPHFDRDGADAFEAPAVQNRQRPPGRSGQPAGRRKQHRCRERLIGNPMGSFDLRRRP